MEWESRTPTQAHGAKRASTDSACLGDPLPRRPPGWRSKAQGRGPLRALRKRWACRRQRSRKQGR
eukprot:scaffold211079_cov25-Tisochrysis_lutea.AAC.4